MRKQIEILHFVNLFGILTLSRSKNYEFIFLIIIHNNNKKAKIVDDVNDTNSNFLNPIFLHSPLIF